MPKALKPTKSALELTTLFDELGAEYVAWVQSRHLESGVSFVQLRLLGTLYLQGPQIMNELSEEIDVTPRYITKLVSALESEGLVKRTRHKTDGRATVVSLTPKGSSLGVLMSGPHQEQVASLFNCITERERAQLRGLLGKVRKELVRLRGKDASLGNPADREVST